MEKVRILFNRPNSSVEIDMVVMKFRCTDSVVAVFTNLMQNFFFVEDSHIVPEIVSRRTFRKFSYKGKPLVEFEDLIYAVKYEMNNGMHIEPKYIAALVRIKEAIRNMEEPTVRAKIIECLSKEDKNGNVEQ